MFIPGKFIVNNYKQALQCKQTLSLDLAKAKAALGIESNDVFSLWLADEYNFLSQNTEPISVREVMAMDYVKILKDLEKAT